MKILLAAVVLGALVPQPASAAAIVDVSGYRSTGFLVRMADGTDRSYPPIRMARLECLDGRDTEGDAAYRSCLRTVRLQYAHLAELRDRPDHR